MQSNSTLPQQPPPPQQQQHQAVTSASQLQSNIPLTTSSRSLDLPKFSFDSPSIQQQHQPQQPLQQHPSAPFSSHFLQNLLNPLAFSQQPSQTHFSRQPSFTLPLQSSSLHQIPNQYYISHQQYPLIFQQQTSYNSQSFPSNQQASTFPQQLPNSFISHHLQQQQQQQQHLQQLQLQLEEEEEEEAKTETQQPFSENAGADDSENLSCFKAWLYKCVLLTFSSLPSNLDQFRNVQNFLQSYGSLNF